MDTTILVKFNKEETSDFFKQLAKRKAEEILADPNNYQCSITVDMDTKGNTEFKSVEILFRPTVK